MSVDIVDKRILITGASGSLGKQLIYELGRRGIDPVAQVRKTSDTAYIDALGLEKRSVDLCQQEKLDELVEGIDLVIHTAAWVNFRQDRLTQFAGINTRGAINLFRAAKKAGVKRFLHASTVAAVAAVARKPDGKKTDNDQLAGEQDEFNLGRLHIPYIITKRAAELELRKAASNGPTELVIVNPSIIVAPSRTGDDRGKASKILGRFVIPDIPIRINLVDIRDVAPGIIAALERGRNGERYILAGDNVAVRDLVLAMSAILGKTPHLVRFPRAFYDFLARASLALGSLLGRGKISFYPDLVKMLDFDWVYSSSKAREELGYRSRSIHITLADLLTNNFTGTYMKAAT